MVDDINNIVDVVWYERTRSSDRQFTETQAGAEELLKLGESGADVRAVRG